MSNSQAKRALPPIPHPDHLRKQAKAVLRDLRKSTPTARLADAQALLAAEYGFARWADLQNEVSRRLESPAARMKWARRMHIAVKRQLPFREVAIEEGDWNKPSLFAGAATQFATAHQCIQLGDATLSVQA